MRLIVNEQLCNIKIGIYVAVSCNVYAFFFKIPGLAFEVAREDQSVLLPPKRPQFGAIDCILQHVRFCREHLT